MSLFTVGIDVDLTAYDTLGPWLKWHKEQTGVDMDTSVHDCYNLQPKMSVGAPRGYDPYDFWRMPDLFTANNVQVEEGVQEFVQRLHEADVAVVVISACNHHHLEDKRAAVQRDLSIPFFDSHEKWNLPVDMMIDDNPNIHHGFTNRACRKMPYQGFYHQGVVRRHFAKDVLPMPKSVVKTHCWKHLGDIIVGAAQRSKQTNNVIDPTNPYLIF